MKNCILRTNGWRLVIVVVGILQNLEECNLKTLINDYKIAAQAIGKGVDREHPGIVAATLKSIVGDQGPDVYRDIPQLVDYLKEKNIRDCAIKQVELVLYGSSLVRYLDRLSGGLSAVDINNIVLTAEQAGLSSKAARKTVSDILYSLSVPQQTIDLSTNELAEQTSGGGLYVPPVAYEKEIAKFRRKIQQDQELSEQEFSELNKFVIAGIPVAYTLMGAVYLKGLGVPANQDTALEKLKYAASHGDAEAYGLLGDLYFDHDNMRAFEFYSRPGAMALNEERCDRFRRLHKVKRFHRLQAILFSVLMLVIALFMYIFRASVITGTHIPALIVCTVINLVATSVLWVVHIKNPYQDLRALALPYLITFFVYAQIII